MILEYIISDNRLVKKSHVDYPTHLQDNIALQFDDKDGLLNDKSYAFIKTHDHVEKVKIVDNGCKLPKFVTRETFFTLRVLVMVGDDKMFTNELIVPVRVHDYLDYNRALAHSRYKKAPLRSDAIYDEHMNRYDGKWKYPIIPHHVRNV